MDMAWEDPSEHYQSRSQSGFYGPKGSGFNSKSREGVFDLIEYQDRARDIYSPKRLFELWEDVCKKYDTGAIRSYDLDEMKAVILPKLHRLAQARIYTS